MELSAIEDVLERRVNRRGTRTDLSNLFSCLGGCAYLHAIEYLRLAVFDIPIPWFQPRIPPPVSLSFDLVYLSVAFDLPVGYHMAGEDPGFGLGGSIWGLGRFAIGDGGKVTTPQVDISLFHNAVYGVC